MSLYAFYRCTTSTSSSMARCSWGRRRSRCKAADELSPHPREMLEQDEPVNMADRLEWYHVDQAARR